jgi:hypothetical protein
MSAAAAMAKSSRTSGGTSLFHRRVATRPPARVAHLVTASCAVWLWTSAALAAEDTSAQPNPQTSVAATCRDCGVVRSIKEIRTERKSSRQDTYVNSQQYLQSRPFDQQPLVGPAISFSWGAGSPTQATVGAVGSPEMQQRFVEIDYEITVRFDDGRYGLIEQPDPGDLRVGDRVKLVKGRLERWQ